MPTFRPSPCLQEKYLKKKDFEKQKQLVCSEKYPWLGYNALMGFHCTVCISEGNSMKACDKLSTNGYGADVALRSVQKLNIHAQPGSKHTL